MASMKSVHEMYNYIYTSVHTFTSHNVNNNIYMPGNYSIHTYMYYTQLLIVSVYIRNIMHKSSTNF